MSDKNLCDNCHREPTKFTVETGEKAYWLMVPKENQDPSILTSALDFVYCAIVPETEGDTRHPDNDPDNYYWCADCAASAYPEQDVL